MRVLIVTSLMILMLLGLGTFNYYYFKGTADNLARQVNQIEQQVQKEQWTEADKLTNQFQTNWGKIRDNWTMLLDHQELDNINKSVSRMEKFIEAQDRPGFMAELAELRLLIEHIPAKEALNLKNIL